MADILIIEDGLHERERLVKLFGAANYNVQSAESAEAAEKLINVTRYRLVVLDIGLSDKSGSYLFELLKRKSEVPYVIILTGNPSIHLKQRFLEEGAAAYIVKASPAAENEALLATVQSMLGTAEGKSVQGVALDDFMQLYLTPESRELFLDSDNQIPQCLDCGSNNWLVSFSQKTQLPPVLEGLVICGGCGAEMDLKVG